jgi:hypothetical protein
MPEYKYMYHNFGGTSWRRLLGPNATSRKFADSSPDEVIEIFNLPNPSNRALAL